MTYLDHVGPKVLALSIEHKEVKTLQVSIEKAWDPISMDTKLGGFQPYFGEDVPNLTCAYFVRWLGEKPPTQQAFSIVKVGTFVGIDGCSILNGFW